MARQGKVNGAASLGEAWRGWVRLGLVGQGMARILQGVNVDELVLLRGFTDAHGSVRVPIALTVDVSVSQGAKSLYTLMRWHIEQAMPGRCPVVADLARQVRVSEGTVYRWLRELQLARWLVKPGSTYAHVAALEHDTKADRWGVRQ